MKRIGTLLFAQSALGGLSGSSAPLSSAAVYHSDGSAAKVKALHSAALNGEMSVLIIKLGATGDVVRTTPLLRRD